MKISKQLYTELKTDMETMAQANGLSLGSLDIAGLWLCFNRVTFDRMNDDTHPSFLNGRKRILPFWSRNGESKDIQGNNHWLNRFYEGEDLNDTHIATALKKIAKES